MKKTRIFVALLMVAAMLAFTGCSKDDTADGNVGTGNTTGSGVVNDAEDALDNAADDIEDSMDNMGDNNADDNTSGTAAAN